MWKIQLLSDILKHSAFLSRDSSATFSNINNLIILKPCGAPSIDPMKSPPQMHLYG